MKPSSTARGLSALLGPLRLAGDAAVAVLALWAAFRLRLAVALPFTDEPLPADRFAFFGQALPWLLAAQIALLALAGLYESFRPLPRLDLARRIALACGLQGAGAALAVFFAATQFPRSVLLLYLVFDAAGLYLFRRGIERLHAPPERRLLIVGDGGAARELARNLALHRWHGLFVIGHVPVPGEPAADAAAPELGPRLGTLDDVPALLARGVADDVLLAPRPDGWRTALVDRLAGVRPAHSSVLLLPGPFESLIGRMRYRWVHDLPVIEVVRESEWRLELPLKRAVDLVAASALGLVALPLLAVAAAAVKLTSPGPVLHRQVRIGRGLAPFELWKLRTMRLGAESEGEERLATRDDDRLTPIGALLRRYRLDELPQLAQVLAGKMSLVGPRPERPGFVERYLAEVPGYRERFSVAPGLTGLAQVNGEYDSTAENKLRYDLAYLASRSLWLDLSILARTVRIVLSSRGY